MSSRDSIRLRYPKSHSREQILQLLEEYRREHPEIITAWIQIERADDWSDDPLVEIHRHGIHYLVKHTQCNDYTALSNAWFDWRGKVRTWTFAN